MLQEPVRLFLGLVLIKSLLPCGNIYADRHMGESCIVQTLGASHFDMETLSR
jgi:hypothetical protein